MEIADDEKGVCVSLALGYDKNPTGPWPMQLVVPRAVRMADAIAAINCTINFTVSFLLMVHLLS